ncbi:MAG: ABC transporter ATP-binding protein [Alphaproteobacteria bacterium]|jgi:subfamily B ATP-binding cassette protein MsbA|tara:strand:- start:1156 stop:2880 length:1725 start_codon:yes stop_codon:yes gene_type:complete
MSENRKNFFRISKYFLNYKFKLFISIVCMVIAAACTGFHAWLVQPALDEVLINKDIFYLYFIPAAILITGIIKGLCSYVQVTSLSYMSQRIIEQLRIQVFHRIINLHYNFFLENKTGSLITRITTDTYYLNGAMASTYTSLIKDSLTLFVLLGNMFYQNWKLSIISLIVFPLASIPIRVLGKKVRNITTNLQHQVGELASILEEIFRGAKHVKSFNAEDFEIKKSSKEIENVRHLNFKQEKVIARARPFTETLGAFAASLAIFGGGVFVVNEGMTAGQLTSFLVSLMLAYQPLKSLINLNVTLQTGLGAASRIFWLIDHKIEINDGDKNIKVKFEKLIFKNVFFKYKNHEENIINNFNFEIIKNDRVAFVGPSGSGKTTLLALIIRLFDIDKGDIFLNTVSTKDLKLKNLRNFFSLVSQETVLFDGTIAENIKYNSKANNHKIDEMADLACVSDFTNKLKDKLETKIGENGMKLSGGQRQRLAIARSLVQETDVLLLDEPSSNLDLKTEAKIFENINKIKDKTLIVVAHRLSTIQEFNKIVYVANGTIKEVGTHQKLMEKKGEYYKLYEKQKKH